MLYDIVLDGNLMRYTRFDCICLNIIVYRWLCNACNAIELALTEYKSMGEYSTKVARLQSTWTVQTAFFTVQ